MARAKAAFAWLSVLSLLFLHSTSRATNVLDPQFSSELILNPIGPDMTIEVDWSPCSSHVLTVHKRGFITLYDRMSVAANANARLLYDFQDETYSYWDHAFSALKFHPSFPEEPYIYILYSAEPTPPWEDSCPESSTFDGVNMCMAFSRFTRLKLDVTMADDGSGKCSNLSFDPTVPGNKVVLMDGWCSSSTTHANGDIVVLPDGDFLISVGDGSQPMGDDIGNVGLDNCYRPEMRLPQGRLKAQRLDFLHGKVLRIKAASLLSDGPLGPDDYTYAAIGLRNPYAMTRDPISGDVYVGDVGSGIKEEINRILAEDLATGNVPNFGWPCIEGTAWAGEGAWSTTQCDPAVDFSCTLCSAIWPCVPGSVDAADCSPNYRPPLYEYRGAFPPLDPRYPSECASGAASISALSFFSGGGDYLPHNLVAGDYSYGCLWFFDQGPDGKPDFAAGARDLLSDHKVTSAMAYENKIYTTTDMGVFRNDVISTRRALGSANTTKFQTATAVAAEKAEAATAAKAAAPAEAEAAAPAEAAAAAGASKRAAGGKLRTKKAAEGEAAAAAPGAGEL